jgi:predicted S18 family serine protease
LAAKARAARRAGVDVMIYPADQRCHAEDIMGTVSGMAMIPVDTLTEAIELLRGNIMASITDITDCDA